MHTLFFRSARSLRHLVAPLALLLAVAVVVLPQTGGGVSLGRRAYDSHNSSPAAQRIEAAQRAIIADPKRHEFYNELALALIRRARETGDANFYRQAEAALKDSLLLAPENPEGRKIRISILLQEGEFARALELAAALNKQVPDDVLTYGLIADAQIALGNYEEAEKAVQWMLDLRPGNPAGLIRAACLRELFGDVDGAVDLLDSVYQRTPAAEVEERAWLLSRMAHLRLTRANLDGANRLLRQALEVFPRYHYALRYLARVHIAQKNYSEAAALLREQYQNAPRPDDLLLLAKTLEKARRFKDAQLFFAEFERTASAQTNMALNSNRALIFYYADRPAKRPEALRIARLESARRGDVHTLEALAWAYFVNGKYQEARRAIEKALAVGIRDAGFFYRAGAICEKLKDYEAAARYFAQSLAVNPDAEASPAVRRSLGRLRMLRTRMKNSR